MSRRAIQSAVLSAAIVAAPLDVSSQSATAREGVIDLQRRAPIPAGLQWETQLRHPERAGFVEALAAMGATETSLTVFGGDDPSINILTASESTRAEWRGHVEALNAIGIVPIVYLSEWEHNTTLDPWTRLEIAEATVATFGGLELIACLGEELDAGIEAPRAVAEFLRPTGWPIATHNPHTGAPLARWQAATDQLIRDGLLDVVLAQCRSDELGGFVYRWQRDGVRVIAHEELGGTPPGDRTEWWFASAALAGASGVSIYPGYELECSDLYCPGDAAAAYAPAFLAATRTVDVLAGDKSVWPIDRNGDGIVDGADALPSTTKGGAR